MPDSNFIFSPRNKSEVEFTYNNRRFIIREPDGEEINNAELLKSKFFFDILKRGVPTESEIFEELVNQGRFSQKDYDEKVNECSNRLTISYIAIGGASDEIQLSEAFENCRKIKEELSEILMKRAKYVEYSAESKSNNSYYQALMSACVFDSDGKLVFAEKKPNKPIDLEAGYKNIRECSDMQFITVCVKTFLPFMSGIVNPRSLDVEYGLYAKRREQLGLKDDDIVKQYKSILDENIIEDDEEIDISSITGNTSYEDIQIPVIPDIPEMPKEQTRKEVEDEISTITKAIEKKDIEDLHGNMFEDTEEISFPLKDDVLRTRSTQTPTIIPTGKKLEGVIDNDEGGNNVKMGETTRIGNGAGTPGQ